MPTPALLLLAVPFLAALGAILAALGVAAAY